MLGPLCYCASPHLREKGPPGFGNSQTTLQDKAAASCLELGGLGTYCVVVLGRCHQLHGKKNVSHKGPYRQRFRFLCCGAHVVHAYLSHGRPRGSGCHAAHWKTTIVIRTVVELSLPLPATGCYQVYRYDCSKNVDASWT